MNTHESYVSLETAKLLKKAGFDWKCWKCYNGEVMFDMEPDEIRKQCPQYSKQDIPAPTLAVAQRWLREVKGIHVYVISYRQNGQDKISGYCYKVYEFTQGWEFNCFSYEEALEAGIQKALKITLERGE
jgi:hypothetical protein